MFQPVLRRGDHFPCRLLLSEPTTAIRLLGFRMSSLRKKGGDLKSSALLRFFHSQTRQQQQQGEAGSSRRENEEHRVPAPTALKADQLQQEPIEGPTATLEDAAVDECVVVYDSEGSSGGESLVKRHCRDVGASSSGQMEVSVCPRPGVQPPAIAKSTAGPAASSWTCRVCTFAGNRACILRCGVCDSLRGSTTVPSEAARPVRSERAGPVRKAGVGRRKK